jgi:hypothetical protein
MPLAHVMTLSRRHSAGDTRQAEARMEARTTRRPGQKGTKKLVKRFGDRLIFVRYRYDIHRQRRYTTVELIVDEQPWAPTPADTRP